MDNLRTHENRPATTRILPLLVVAGIGIGAVIFAGSFLTRGRQATHKSPPPARRTPPADPAPHSGVANPLGQRNSRLDTGVPPLPAVLAWVQEARPRIETDIRDYSAVFVKRERNRASIERQSMFIKVRHVPFSVYVHYLEPEDRKGEEAIYVEGQNEGKMLAHTVGLKGKLLGTLALQPDSSLAMKGQRHPITEIGILGLCRALTELDDKDPSSTGTQVSITPNRKINGRPSTCVQILHPNRRPEFLFHLVRLYIDDQLNVPVRLETYDWPSQAGTTPELVEEYTYLDLKLNNSFSDTDFDAQNPKYSFP